MRTPRRSSVISLIAVVFAMTVFAVAHAESRAELDKKSGAALSKLVAQVPAAKILNQNAVGVLVFPSITKAGFMVGGQYGEGVLWVHGKPAGYYNTTGASFGLQAGAQQYGYAMFFMKTSALKALDTAEGFEVGVGPSVVVVDQGMASTMTTTTMQDDIYAFVFGQQGLMAGLGLQGNKVTKLKR